MIEEHRSILKDLQEAALAAAAAAGNGSVTAYLAAQAQSSPAAFMNFLVRITQMQLAAEANMVDNEPQQLSIDIRKLPADERKKLKRMLSVVTDDAYSVDADDDE